MSTVRDLRPLLMRVVEWTVCQMSASADLRAIYLHRVGLVRYVVDSSRGGTSMSPLVALPARSLYGLEVLLVVGGRTLQSRHR